MCRICHHNPHIWLAVGKETDPVDVSTVTMDTAVKNVGGDARNSFLRRAASPAPDLCVVCHEDTALLVGTDHDLLITASSAKNRLGESASIIRPQAISRYLTTVGKRSMSVICRALYAIFSTNGITASANAQISRKQKKGNRNSTCENTKIFNLLPGWRWSF